MSTTSWRAWCVVLGLGGSVAGAPAVAQENLPVLSAQDLGIDASGLRPMRLVYDAVAGPDGAAMLADGALKKPQVSITLDRTIYHLADGRVRDAIRTRWVSNTHPHTDELLVDAQTLATVNERTRAAPGWETREEIVHVRAGEARVTYVSDQEPPSTSTFRLEHSHHYGVMILPFLFASMSVEPGTSFRLPALGSSQEEYIRVDVRGRASFQSKSGEQIEADLVTSRHSWGSIDWYVDGTAPPYHRHAVWHFDGGGSVVSLVAGYSEFEADEWVDAVDPELLRRRTGR